MIHGQAPCYNLISVFTNQREEITSFINNVLRQLPANKILELVDCLKQESKYELDDVQLYEKMCNKIMPLRSYLDITKIINLTNFQKNILGKQIESLLGDVSTMQNCLEIGTPGTYLSTIKNSTINGEICVLLEQPKITDLFQAHSWDPFNGFKGYSKCIDLNNYEPISSEIPDNHFDLIVCTIGLHHVPSSKLDAFITSINRVLCPGGIFLLREHNAHSKELELLAYAAHSLYNAIIPQETTKAEIQEVRNFKSLTYWKTLLQDYGFTISPEEYLQDGDSTLNTFIKCTKKCITPEEQILAASMIAKRHIDYSRDSAQTYLTTPEWNNVDAAQQYGTYITKIPFYEFPYMAHVKTFWKTFFDSWCCAAHEKGGHMKLLLSSNIFSNYILMNVFIGAFMTVEYSVKALVSLPIRTMFSGVEATTLLALIRDPYNELSSIDSSIIVKENYEGSIKLVSIPRYMQFLTSIKKIMNSSITFVKIANNENIVCKIRYKTNKPFNSTAIQKFTWQMPTLPEYIYAAYLVPVQELKEFVRVVEQQDGELLYIHDF
jgi:SAM-dependent methyltransferase